MRGRRRGVLGGGGACAKENAPDPTKIGVETLMREFSISVDDLWLFLH